MNRFHAILAKRLSVLDPEDREARQQLYARVRSELDRLIAASNPPLSAYQRLKRMQDLEIAITDVEEQVEKSLAARRAQGEQPYAQPQLPAPGASTPLPPRQGRNVDELVDDQAGGPLSLGVIATIIVALVLLMLIGVIIALDPSTLDILKRNPGQ
ncbi:MAG: hypothetical protein KDJ68_04180 [Rhodobiaceae bacterium]|nr:hypothetical protein [Rhodobiaceae bacterium]MCC0041902.1 hypothetical protein [Rhodobiaceae bacterium]